MSKRTILLGSLALLAVAVFGIWYAITSTVRGITDGIGLTASLEQVYFLQDLPEGDVAVLLSPILTGGAPLLVRDQAAISAARNRAYVMDKTGGGEGLGSFFLAMIGGQNMQPVLTVYIDRAAHSQIVCNANQCRDNRWIDPDLGHDIANLARAGERLDIIGEVHWEYDSYRTAFEAIANDPNIFFTHPGQETLADPSSTQHLFRLMLPSDLQPIGSISSLDDFNSPEELQVLKSRLDEAFAGLDVSYIDMSYSSDGNPYLTDPDGLDFRPEGGSLITLIGYSLVTPNIVLGVAEADIPALRDRVAQTNWPTSDAGILTAAVSSYLSAQGLPNCQPACVIDANRHQQIAELNAFSPPSWDLRVWRVRGTP